MNYEFNSEMIYDEVDREVSRIASSSATEDGQSLYDSFVLKHRDRPTIDKFFDLDNVSIISRFQDIAIPIDTGIYFNVPDFEENLSGEVQRALDAYHVYLAVARWLEEKGSEKSEGYAVQAKSQLDIAERLLMTRRKPTRV